MASSQHGSSIGAGPPACRHGWWPTKTSGSCCHPGRSTRGAARSSVGRRSSPTPRRTRSVEDHLAGGRRDAQHRVLVPPVVVAGEAGRRRVRAAVDEPADAHELRVGGVAVVLQERRPLRVERAGERAAEHVVGAHALGVVDLRVPSRALRPRRASATASRRRARRRSPRTPSCSRSSSGRPSSSRGRGTTAHPGHPA